MRHANPARLNDQLSFLRRQFAQDAALPFSDVLSEDLVTQALTTACVSWIDRWMQVNLANLLRSDTPQQFGRRTG